MQLISSVTVTNSTTGQVTFSSIPQTYTDLLVVMSFRTVTIDGNTQIPRLWFNNDTSSNMQRRALYATGSGSAVSDTQPNSDLAGYVSGGTDTANTFANASIYIPNYTGSAQKTYSLDCVTENNGTTARQLIQAGRWNNTAAITRIDLYTFGWDYLVQNSTAYLYGILKGSGGATVS